MFVTIFSFVNASFRLESQLLAEIGSSKEVAGSAQARQEGPPHPPPPSHSPGRCEGKRDGEGGRGYR